jgi:hypothetical protein
MKKTQVARLLAYVTGMGNQQLLPQNGYPLLNDKAKLSVGLPR